MQEQKRSHDQSRVIYKVTNMVNGKVYIGLTLRTLRERIYGHKYRMKHPKHQSKKDVYFYNALRKYGMDKFKWEIIDVSSIKGPSIEDKKVALKELNEKEKYWISFYESFGKNGYNLTLGGGGRLGSTFKHTEKAKRKIGLSNRGKRHTEESKRRLSLSRMGRFTGKDNHFFGKHHSEETKKLLSESKKGVSVHTEESKRKLSEALSGENHPFWGKFGENAPRTKQVVQLTIDGEYVAEYPTAKDANRAFCESDGSSIVQCCKGNYKTIHGFRWLYKEDYERYLNGEFELPVIEEPKKHGKRPIVQLTLDGEYVAEYETAKEYAISIGKKDGAVITGVCRGRYKTAYGYKWMYKGDYETF